MAAAALMEEQLQNSMATSDEDAEFEEDDELAADLLGDNADSYAANNQLHNGMLAEQSVGDEDEGIENEDEEMLSDEDAEGEEDDEMIDSAPNNGDEDSDEDEASEEEDGEGVGAVKIQPGLLEDDEDVLSATDDDDESIASVEDDDESKDSTDAEVEVEWEPAAEEEEEPANPNRCV
jgi:histone acetyltransferase SAS3